ncbi:MULTISPECIES: macro domain-containing protein [unclassified Bifidobacterium]|uniref:macro domain-containing protein n=1 Tax=unclassified Bifidobacterium TaxID=2608897 RepID=UPI0011269874|nr:MULTISPECIES: macro domain-containing protein [unclassified Bifidobacterium]TPF79776.1 Appr-1-p processing protein [Bifidobacterium sp. UTCIF-24]TPF84811.1 Appr-1-p processing protein [Bifidobacterium sp. UTCIF-36]TPF88893.1 Appr-1-p processing protein [Bifidobacterium sp. UTBIF-56]
MPLQLVRQDITRMPVDVIVNAANTRLLMGGGVCGAIFRAAGTHRLQKACDRISPIRTGEAVATPGFDLPARYVIHTAGPIWQGGGHDEERLLRACYRNSLALAVRLGCESIAFPLISSGIYGYPKAEALRVAIDEIRRFLEEEPCTRGDGADAGEDDGTDAVGGDGSSAGDASDDLDVYLCVFDKAAFAAGTELDRRIREYIDDHYVAEHAGRPSDRAQEMRELGYWGGVPAGYEIEAAGEEPEVVESSATESSVAGSPVPFDDADESAVATPMAAPEPRGARSINAADVRRGPEDDVLADLDEPFNVILMRLIDAKGYSDVDVYKRANINRKLFSKIRCGNGYMPGKKTVLALAIALRLDIDETDDLLACAGYALSHSVKFDVIVEFFIVHGVFDVFVINETLFRYDQPLLGQ